MKAWLIGSAVLLVVTAGVWVLYTYPPAEHSFYPRCVFKAVTGFDCAGCGSTRAAHALLHGRFAEAFRYNPLIFAFGFVGLFAMPSFARGRSPELLMHPWFGWGTLFVVAGWGIARNLM